MPPKRRSITNNSSPVLKKIKTEHSEEDLKTFLLSTLQLVTNLRDDNNRILSKEFFKLPSKKLYPDYYQLIKEPVSINEIKSKLINNKYKSGSEFLLDFQLMNKNAKSYNDLSSIIALDCDFILNFVEDQVKQFNGEATKNPSLIKEQSEKIEEEKEQESVPQINTEKDEEEIDYTKLLKTLIYQCINYKPYKRNKISPPFMDIVDGQLYPDYYKIISKGMSFNLLLQQLPDYKNDLSKFLSDINLIWTNAQTYNDEGSLIYQDSVKLCDYFYKKFAEFVEREGIDISYEIPEPVITENQNLNEGSQQPEKKKRGRPRLEDIVADDPPPIKFDDDDGDEKEDEDEEDDDDEELAEDNSDKKNGKNISKSPEELQPLPLSIKQENGINKFLGYKRYSAKSPNEVFKNFIKSITICSSRNMYKKSNLQDTKVGIFVSDLEKTIPEYKKFFQSFSTEFFQYKFAKDDLSSTNFSLNLKNINTLQIDTMLNMLTIGTQKFEQVLFFNGEKINASPSVYEIQENDMNELNRLSLSKFDINLLPGLNSIEFVVKVGPIISVDKNGKLPSRHATNPNNEKNYITERCCIWITVDQF